MINPAVPSKAVIALLALIKFLIPFILIHPAFELQRDEYLYYQQGQHFDFGYLENPPLISWLGYISSLLGGSEWTVRLWPALIGAFTVIITCLITERLGGKGFAQFLAGFGIITGAFLRIHILFQPNILDIFFWTCSMYFLIRFVQTENKKDFLWMAVCLASGWWSKYSVLFLISAIFTGLLLSRHRKVFLQKQTYIALLIASLIILPNLWWQYAHRFPLIHHMEELRATQLVYINKADFIKEQFLLLFPVLFVWICGLAWFFSNPTYRIFAWIYLAVISFILFGSGKGYYALGIYPLLLAAGGMLWEKWSLNKKWLRYVAIILAVGLTLPFTPIGLPMMNPENLAAFYKKSGIAETGLLKWEDQGDHELPQDFADMLGWKELTERTEKFVYSLPDSIKENTRIYGANYGQAGALKFYGKKDGFKNSVLSENGSFQLWINDKTYIKHLIIIDDEVPEPTDEVVQHFKKITVIDSVRNIYSRQFGDKIFFLENLDSAGLKLAWEGFRENKKRFNR
jgi:4-amino-4-deoxy-L-arabinose transferase-like glycosyltransferase